MKRKRKITANGRELTLINGNKVFVGKLKDKRTKKYPFVIRLYNAERKKAIVLGVSEKALIALGQLIFEIGLNKWKET